jgi:hypothetical protein
MIRIAIAQPLLAAVGLLCLSAAVAPVVKAQKTDGGVVNDTLFSLKNPDAPSCPPDEGLSADERRDKRSSIAWPSSRFIVLSSAERGGSGLRSAAQGQKLLSNTRFAAAMRFSSRL